MIFDTSQFHAQLIAQSLIFRIKIPFSVSSTTTWDDSFSSYFRAISAGIIRVAEILLIKNIFDIPFEYVDSILLEYKPDKRYKCDP